MKNLLVEELQADDSKGLFVPDTKNYSYRTGIPVMDYALGYRVNVYDGDTLVDTYNSLGISNGCQVCMIGKPSTGKTTAAVQFAAAITRGLPNAFTIHFDLEQAQSYPRLKNITKFKISEMEDEKKYILKQGFYSIGDIKAAIMRIYKAKIANPKEYMYDTGKRDVFGKPLILYVPTVVIIDSIPLLATDVNLNDKKDRARVEEVSSQTDRMRVTGEISRFYNEILPYQRDANIILISINQIKSRSQIGLIPSPSEMLYLGQDEAFNRMEAILREKYTKSLLTAGTNLIFTNYQTISAMK